MSSDRTKESAKVERDNVSIVIFINRSRNCHMLVSGEARYIDLLPRPSPFMGTGSNFVSMVFNRVDALYVCLAKT